jgi:hypothetical protein
VLACEVGDEIRGGVDRPSGDRLHEPTIPVGDDSSPVTTGTHDDAGRDGPDRRRLGVAARGGWAAGGWED